MLSVRFHRLCMVLPKVRDLQDLGSQLRSNDSCLKASNKTSRGENTAINKVLRGRQIFYSRLRRTERHYWNRVSPHENGVVVVVAGGGGGDDGGGGGGGGAGGGGGCGAAVAVAG